MDPLPAPAPRSRPFVQVDVFSRRSYRGNPVAVVLDAEGLSDPQMQQIAAWTDLSETTFVLPPTLPGADYRVRIFTPHAELPFAGHPTLGTARAWLDVGGEAGGERVVQECAIGAVEVRRVGSGHEERLAFAAPPLLREGPLEAEHIGAAARALGIATSDVLDHAWVDNGPGWAVLELPSSQAVLDLDPDYAAIPGTKIAAVGPCPAGAEHAYEVRAFVAAGYEDPVTGSLQAGIARRLLDRGRASVPWTAHQGTCRGRDGVVHLDPDVDGTVWAGGTATVLIRGEITA